MGYYKTCPDCNGEGVIEQIEAPSGRPYCFPCRCGTGLVPVAEGTVIEINDETVERMVMEAQDATLVQFGTVRGDLAAMRRYMIRLLRAAAGEEKP